MKLDIFSNDR